MLKLTVLVALGALLVGLYLNMDRSDQSLHFRQPLKRSWRLVTNSTQPEISVIIPFHNIYSKFWFADTLISLSRQSFQQFEVLIVDDACSSLYSLDILGQIEELIQLTSGYWDGSIPWLDSYEPPSPTRIPLRLIHRKSNGGLSASRNTGVAHSSTNLVFFLDPDDFLDEYALEQLYRASLTTIQPEPQFQYRYSREFRYGWIYPSVYHFKTLTDVPYAEVSADFSTERLQRENYLTSACLISKEAYMRIGGMCTQTKYFEDYDFWARMVSFGFVGVLVQESKFWYRRHQHGNSAKIFNSVISEADLRKDLRMNNPVLFQDMSRKQLKDIVSCRFDSDCSSNFVSTTASLTTYLPCYQKWNQHAWLETEYLPSKMLKAEPISSLDIDPEPLSIVYVIPWTLTGGAEYYDLNVIQAIRALTVNTHITLVLERHIPVHLQKLREKFRAVVDETWQLQQVSNSTETQDSILNYLIASRRAQLVINRSTVTGYRYIAASCDTVAYEGFSVPAPKIIDVLHLYDVDSKTSWEWRAGSVSGKVDARIAISQDLARYMADVVATQTIEPYSDMNYTLCNATKQATLHVITPPIGDSWLSKSQEKFTSQLQSTTRFVFFLGRFEIQKDPFLWVRTAGAMARHKFDYDYRFEMIGDGPLRFPVMNWTSKNFPNMFNFSLVNSTQIVNFRGTQDHLAIQKALLEEAFYNNVLLFTSRFEGIPMVVLEALSIGVPVLAVDCTSKTGGGLREIIDQEHDTDELKGMLVTVEPVWSRKRPSHDFEGSACNMAEHETSLLLAERLKELFEAMDASCDKHSNGLPDHFSGWRRRVAAAETLRTRFGTQRFKEAWESVFKNAGLLA